MGSKAKLAGSVAEISIIHRPIGQHPMCYDGACLTLSAGAVGELRPDLRGVLGEMRP